MMFVHPRMQFRGVPSSFYHLMPVFPTNKGTPRCYSSLHRPTLALPILHLYCSFLTRQLSFLLTHVKLRKATESYLCLAQFKQFPQVVYSFLIFLSCHAPQLHSTSGTHCINMLWQHATTHPSIPSPSTLLELRKHDPRLIESSDTRKKTVIEAQQVAGEPATCSPCSWDFTKCHDYLQ